MEISFSGPHFQISSVYTYTIWYRATKFDMMTPYGKCQILGVKPIGMDRGGEANFLYLIYILKLFGVQIQNLEWRNLITHHRDGKLWHCIRIRDYIGTCQPITISMLNGRCANAVPDSNTIPNFYGQLRHSTQQARLADRVHHQAV